MIGRLTGTLLEKNPPDILLDVQGVGYEIAIPMSTLYALPERQGRVTLHTQLLVREDAHLLYGFATLREREVFRQLLKISGVGARTALAILSGLSVDDLAQAVLQQDAAWLTRVPGIGKKTAERLLLELRGKLDDGVALPAQASGAPSVAGVAREALQALLALGYSDKEAALAIKALPEGLTVEDSIRQALRALGKGR